MIIRTYTSNDLPMVIDVFRSSVHGIACHDYRPEQLAAWAPAEVNLEAWATRLQKNQPFLVEDKGRVVAFADIQNDGLIDQFFVAASHARRGVGTALMNQLLESARQRQIGVLNSFVSLTAQPFFERFGFEIIEQRLPVLNGVFLPNALMRRTSLHN